MRFSLLSHQFSLVLDQKNKFEAHGILFYFVISENSLIGFTINKSLGNAVSRNSFKRSCRSLFFSKKNLCNLHLVVRPVVPLCDVDNLSLSFNQLYEFVGRA